MAGAGEEVKADEGPAAAPAEDSYLVEKSAAAGSTAEEGTAAEYLEEERDMMRELVAHNKRSGERFAKFQEWVRRELDEKGYVEVGEDYIAQSIINRESVTPELWSSLMGELKLDG